MIRISPILEAALTPLTSQRIFNMTSQSEKSDPDGDCIRYWVPELKNVKGKGE